MKSENSINKVRGTNPERQSPQPVLVRHDCRIHSSCEVKLSFGTESAIIHVSMEHTDQSLTQFHLTNSITVVSQLSEVSVE